MAEPDFDLPAILYPTVADFPCSEVIRTKYFVAVVLPVRDDRLFIGIRGTQFAYDWLINVKIAKTRDIESGEYFHVGFLREAQELLSALDAKDVMSRYADRDIYVCGHSLGGAVGALINQWRRARAGYIFGTPRIGNAFKPGLFRDPFAMRRHLDVIPHCPPAIFGYANFTNQITPQGQSFEEAGGLELYFFASWLFELSVARFPQNHGIECYRLELLQAVKQDPNFERWIGQYPDAAP